MVSRKMVMKILCGNFENKFLKCEKMASRKDLPALPPHEFFMFILLISNHTVFLIQFVINLHWWVFQTAEIALVEAAHAISAFLKNSLVQINYKWTQNRLITYTNVITVLYMARMEKNQRKLFIRECLLFKLNLFPKSKVNHIVTAAIQFKEMELKWI